MSNEQKLREALQKAKDALSLALSDVDWRKDSPTQPVIHKAYNCAHQALALPTAAPVGEREAFERTMMDKFGWQRNDFKLDDFGYFDGHTDTAWMAWQARAVLSARDALDAARYRWLADCSNYPEAVTLISDGSLTADALGKAIDAAIAQGVE